MEKNCERCGGSGYDDEADDFCDHCEAGRERLNAKVEQQQAHRERLAREGEYRW